MQSVDRFVNVSPHPNMTTYYSGEYNGGELIGVIVTFTVITGLLVIWRIAFRFTRTTLNLSDYCIIISLVGYSLVTRFNFHMWSI